jgi:hypothetical protein
MSSILRSIRALRRRQAAFRRFVATETGAVALGFATRRAG